VAHVFLANLIEPWKAILQNVRFLHSNHGITPPLFRFFRMVLVDLTSAYLVHAYSSCRYKVYLEFGYSSGSGTKNVHLVRTRIIAFRTKNGGISRVAEKMRMTSIVLEIYLERWKLQVATRESICLYIFVTCDDL
jgi:hypothetical protein